MPNRVVFNNKAQMLRVQAFAIKNVTKQALSVEDKKNLVMTVTEISPVTTNERDVKVEKDKSFE